MPADQVAVAPSRPLETAAVVLLLAYGIALVLAATALLGAGDDVLLDAGLHIGNQFRRLALIVIRDVDQVGGAGLRALRQLGLSRWPA